MDANAAIALGSVQKTLLLPLWGRAVETGKAHPLLVDAKAAEIVAALDYDFAGMGRGLSPITRLSWIARSLHIDHAIQAFLEHHPEAAVVNLGCGLDTSFERVDNGRLLWYDVDLPDVIALRRRLIPEGGRRRAIAASALDRAWHKRIESRGGLVVAAAGLLYYFHEDEIRALLLGLADDFPGAELVFDACSPLGRGIANRRVIAAGGMDAGAMLQWGLRRAKDIEAWDPRLRVIAHYPMFRGMRRGLRLGELAGTLLADALGIMSMVHLRLRPRP